MPCSKYTNCMIRQSIHKLYASPVNTQIVCLASQYTNCMSRQSIHKLYVMPVNALIICLGCQSTNCLLRQSIHRYMDFLCCCKGRECSRRVYSNKFPNKSLAHPRRGNYLFGLVNESTKIRNGEYKH